MIGMTLRLLKKTSEIVKEVDDFLDQVSGAGLLFKSAINDYLHEHTDAFDQSIKEMIEIEHRGDALRRSLETQLYTKTLIPESRGDVLELLESMDQLLGLFKAALWRFDIEHPTICLEFHDDFQELTACGVDAVEATVLSCRAFFKNIDTVSDHLHKVTYWEKTSDTVSTRLQRKIFSRQDLRLSHKRHLRDFARHLEKIADEAEDVADRLSIYVIKRSI
jgi:predicted phosphate transport protein (TIGR00153 family)